MLTVSSVVRQDPLPAKKGVIWYETKLYPMVWLQFWRSQEVWSSQQGHMAQWIKGLVGKYF